MDWGLQPREGPHLHAASKTATPPPSGVLISSHVVGPTYAPAMVVSVRLGLKAHGPAYESGACGSSTLKILDGRKNALRCVLNEKQGPQGSVL